MSLYASNPNRQVQKRLPIGQILLENGCIFKESLNTALSRQKIESKKIGSILTTMNVCSERQVAHALAIQNNLPWLCLENSTIENRIIGLIPKKIALQFKLLPVFLIQNQLVLATEDPLNPDLINYLAELEYQTVLAAAPGNKLESLLALHYPGPAISESVSQTDLEGIPQKDQREWAWPGKTGKKSIISPSTFFDSPKTPLSKPIDVADLYRSAKPGRYSQKNGADLFAATYPAVERAKRNIPFEGVRLEKTELKANTKTENSSIEDVTLKSESKKIVISVNDMAKPSLNKNQVQAIGYFESGIVKLQNGILQEALELFEKSFALDPDNRVCKANIKRIQQLLNDEDIKGF